VNLASRSSISIRISLLLIALAGKVHIVMDALAGKVHIDDWVPLGATSSE
jgi:hypothetical protein